MDKLAVNGDSIVLQPVGFLWQGWDGKLPLNGTNIITSEGKSVILEKDVMVAALQGMGKMYVAPPFATPGSILNLQLTVTPVTLSLSVSIQGMKVVTAATMGTYTATVMPAMNPQGVPDPLITKVGQWTVQATSQSSFKSGVPVPVPPEDPTDGSGQGESQLAERKDHWVGVVVEDSDGNPLANQIASLELANGQVVQRLLSDSGAARVDGIVLDEEKSKRTCVVRMVFDPKRVPVPRTPEGFIAVQVVDDAGQPIAAREATLTLPDGSKLVRMLDELGRARFAPVPLGSKCNLEIAPAQVALEFTLVDEDGAPLANKPFTVKDSTGVEVSGVLDADGFASVVVAEGECDLSVDFDAAVAGAGSDTEAPGSGAGADESTEAVSSGEEDAPAEPGESAAITTTLRLLDVSGSPLAGQTLTVVDSEGTKINVTSNDEGVILFKSASSGELTVTFGDAG